MQHDKVLHFLQEYEFDLEVTPEEAEADGAEAMEEA